MNDNADKAKRVYVNLVSLRKNLPKDHPNNKMEWDEVNSYNGLLADLQSLGFNTSDFEIPKDMLIPERAMTNYVSRETEETGRSNVRHGFFVTKLDALLSYFELDDKKVKFGFHDSDSE